MNTDKRKQLSTMLADELKVLRESRGWTLVALADHMDHFVTPQALGLYEKGLRMPSVEVTEKLADAFGVSRDVLIQSRALAVMHTCELLGEDTPPSIRNERNMLAHGQQYKPSKADTDAPQIIRDGAEYVRLLAEHINHLEYVSLEGVRYNGRLISHEEYNKITEDVQHMARALI